MLKQHKEKLRNNHVQLVNEMNGESIIHELYQKKFISQIAMESLLDTPMILLACLQVELIDELTMDSIYSNGKTDLKRNFILLQYLLKRTCNKDLLSKLIEAFRLADYQELARDLQTEPLFD